MSAATMDWLRSNTVEYRGYMIQLGSVYLKGECQVMAHLPINASDELRADMLASAKAYVDKRVDA